MIYSYGARIDVDSNAITVIDEENRSAETTGYVNGEYVEFSGGGGSSDFSTAEVTLVNNSSRQFQPTLLPLIMDSGEHAGVLASWLPIQPQSTVTLKAPLYKGNCSWDLSLLPDFSFTGSGDVIVMEYEISITGDCTITVSNAS